jgi:hypothetical protein
MCMENKSELWNTPSSVVPDIVMQSDHLKMHEIDRDS